MKPVLVLMAPGFEEIELTAPIDILRRLEIPVVTAGVKSRCVEGAHGMSMMAEMLMVDVNAEDYSGIILPGGPASWLLRDTPGVLSLVRAMHKAEKLVAAICAAPTLLARHRLIGVGNYAVCYPGMEDLLTAAGVTPSMEDAVILDESLITSKAPGTVFDFALSLLEVLTNSDTAARIQADLHYGV
jgi:4-methyl-5(b-hydroxyethyl)-thiazole monophosphate biosynthesis